MLGPLFVSLAALPLFAFWSRKRAEVKFPPPPAWASFFTPERYAQFEREIHRYFQRNEIACQVHDGVVYVFQAGDKTPRHQWGLLNLAQVCNQGVVEEWAHYVQMHFDAMLRSEKEHAELQSQIGDLAAIRDRIGVRLGPPDMPLDKLISREDIPGVFSYIVIDLPSSMVSVNSETLARWGISSEQIFDIALANLRKAERPQCQDFEVGKGLSIIAALGDSFFTASHALLLSEYPQFVGPHGSLVSVPHRHALLCYPIRDLNVVGVLHHLWSITQGMEKEGPGSISPQIYWYFQGNFVPIPCEIKDSSIAVTPPEAFINMLNSLGDPDAPAASPA